MALVDFSHSASRAPKTLVISSKDSSIVSAIFQQRLPDELPTGD
ncbi:MAG TPA: hypothetical protein VIQ31_07465 [Phormidium sp.]